MCKDELVRIWRRYHYKSEDSTDLDYSELLYDTEELILPEENGGSATVEIFDDEHELIEDNSITSYAAMQSSLKSVKLLIYNLINELPVKIYHLPISLLKEVLEYKNWKMTESYPKEFNNIKLLFHKDKNIIKVEQNIITGETLISKKDELNI